MTPAQESASPDLVSWLRGALDEAERIADAAIRGPWQSARLWRQRPENAAFMTANGPAHVLAAVSAHREILAVVTAWEHEECDDSFYSCELEGPGLPANAAGCSCGLVARQVAVLGPLAKAYGWTEGS